MLEQAKREGPRRVRSDGREFLTFLFIISFLKILKLFLLWKDQTLWVKHVIG